MRKINLALILWLGLAFPCFADKNYNEECTYNGNGTSMSCAAGAGQAGAWNVATSITGLSAGEDLAIMGGTTVHVNVKRIDAWPGLSTSDRARVYSYRGEDGSLPRAVIDGRTTLSTSWTSHSGAIYYQSSTYSEIYLMMDNEVRMRKIKWRTDLATTLAQMVAGTFVYDATNKIIYVWLSGSDDPSGHVMKSGANGASGYCFTAVYDHINTPYPAYSYVSLEDVDVIGCGSDGVEFLAAGGIPGTGNKMHDVSVSYCGGSCAVLGGDFFDAYNITGFDAHSEDRLIQPVIRFEGGGVSAPSIGMTADRIFAFDARNGSAFEVNHGVTYSTFTNWEAENWVGNLVEVWESHHNTFSEIYGKNTEYPFCVNPTQTDDFEGRCRGTYSGGFMFNGLNNPSSSYNTLYNFMVVGGGNTVGDSSGVAVQGAVGGPAVGNTILNGTIINTDATRFSGIRATGETDTGNTFKNIVISLLGSGSGVVGEWFASTTGNTSDYNIVYVPNGVFGSSGDSSDQVTYTFSAWKTATGQDAHTSTQDPRVTGDGRLYADSPAINAGDDSVCPSTDIDGDPRMDCDIGADEFWAQRISGMTNR